MAVLPEIVQPLRVEAGTSGIEDACEIMARHLTAMRDELRARRPGNADPAPAENAAEETP